MATFNADRIRKGLPRSPGGPAWPDVANAVLAEAVRSTGATAKLVNDTSRIAANFERNAGQMLSSSANLTTESETLSSLVGRFTF